jgi:hypothetical protein
MRKKIVKGGQHNEKLWRDGSLSHPMAQILKFISYKWN